VVDFEQMGVDGLGVDEAHEFKNLFYHTKMQRVAGLGTPTGSGKAFDLFVKVRYLAQRFGGKAPFIPATGTPVSNSLVEMFTMMRYAMYDELKRRNINHLDSWAKVFGNVANVYEVHPSGQGYRLATRFAKFVNLPELMTLYKSFADVITMKDLKAQSEAEGKRFPVPNVKGGKPAEHGGRAQPAAGQVLRRAGAALQRDGTPS
jgi:N12 class adenine-specific DNA methylase